MLLVYIQCIYSLCSYIYEILQRDVLVNMKAHAGR